MLCELIGTQGKGGTREFYAIVSENGEGDAVIGSASSTSVTLAKHIHLLAFSSQNLECCIEILSKGEIRQIHEMLKKIVGV